MSERAADVAASRGAGGRAEAPSLAAPSLAAPSLAAPSPAAPSPAAPGTVRRALASALLLALGTVGAWPLGLFYPLFSIDVERGAREGPRLVDALGHLDPIRAASALIGEGLPTLRLGIGLSDRIPVPTVAAVIVALIWIRLQGRAAAGLLVDLDLRRSSAPRPGVLNPLRLWRHGKLAAGDCSTVLTIRLLLSLAAVVLLLALPWRVATPPADGFVDDLPRALALGLAGLGAVGYLVLVEVVCQLALVSCVANGRGAISAWRHAWRLVGAAPALTLRAGLGHFALVAVVAGSGARAMWHLEGALGWLVAGLLFGFAGVAHAGLWDRVYSSLGGWRSRAADVAP
jgi:hypothetical protein